MVALSAAGCSLIAATRSPTPERGAIACSNLLDDDLDGALDCDDVECDGACAEETLRACTDGRDNDGDGVLDGADARCWHHVAPAASSCATVRGSRVEPRIDEGALVWRGVAANIPDPRGGGGSVFAARDNTFAIAPVASSTGALDGLRVQATLRVSRDVETTIELLPSGELGDLPDAGGRTRFVRLVLGRSIELLSNRTASTEMFYSPFTAPTWVDAELVIRGRTVAASVALSGGTLTPVRTIELPPDIVDPIELDVLVRAERATVDVPMLGSLAITRVALPSCGRAEVVPEIREEGFDLVVGVARGGPSGARRCAISTADGAGRSHFADGDGDWQPSAQNLPSSGFIGAAFAWDAGRQRFVGIAARGPDLVDGTATSFDRIESDDCVSWTAEPLTLPEVDGDLGVFGRGFYYAVDADGSHAVSLLVSRDGDFGILTLRSADGDPGLFRADDEVQAVGPATTTLFAGGGLAAIERIGSRDLVLLATSNAGLIALTPRGSAARFEALSEPVLAQSDVPGTFDRGRLVGPPRLLHANALQQARVFYGGTSFGNCVGCSTSGSALFTTRSAP